MWVQIQVYNWNGNLYTIGDELYIQLHPVDNNTNDLKPILVSLWVREELINIDYWNNAKFKVENFDNIFNIINSLNITSRFYNNWQDGELLNIHFDNIKGELEYIKSIISNSISNKEKRDYLLNEFDKYTKEYTQIFSKHLSSDFVNNNMLLTKEKSNSKLQFFLNWGMNSVALEHLIKNLWLREDEIKKNVINKEKDIEYSNYLSFIINNKDQLLKLLVSYNYIITKYDNNTFILTYNWVSDSVRAFIHNLLTSNNTWMFDEEWEDVVKDNIINAINETQLLFY